MARILSAPAFVPRRQARPDGSIWGAFIVCTTCGATGMPGGRWLDNCIKHPDHPHRCSCGKRYPSRGALAAHIRAEDRWRPSDAHNRLAIFGELEHTRITNQGEEPMTSTAPYPTFAAEYFANSDQKRAWENLQHELYRDTPYGTQVRFIRDLGEGTLVAEISDNGQRLVVATLKPFRGELVVQVYGAKHVEATAIFENFEHAAVFFAVTSFITRSAER